MNKEQIIAYQSAHHAWLRASYSGGMGEARKKQEDINREAVEDEGRQARAEAVPRNKSAAYYRRTAAKINDLLDRLFTAPANGTTLRNEVIDIDTSHFVGRKIVRHVCAPTFGDFYISESRDDEGSFAIDWAYPEDNGVPVLLHEDMRGYLPANAQAAPSRSLAALDDQLETVRLICEDAGVDVPVDQTRSSEAL